MTTVTYTEPHPVIFYESSEGSLWNKIKSSVNNLIYNHF